MDWASLFPTTFNPVQALHGSGDEESFIRGLADVFILVIVYFGSTVLLAALVMTIRSFFRTKFYFRGLPKPKDRAEFPEVKDSWVEKNDHLAANFSDLLVRVPTGDDSFETELRRCGNAEEVFNEQSLAHRIVGNRFFMAMPGLLTGIGVLGTFVGLALGIGALELEGDKLEELDKSIQPLISGSATAFMTSVWGVIASLVFAIAEKGLESVARSPIRSLQHRLNSLVPLYLPENSMIDLQRSSLENERTMKGLAVAIGEQMQKALDRIGESVTDAVRDALGGQAQDLGAMSANLMSEALAKELEDMKTAITEMAEGFKSEFNGANSELQETIGGFNEIIKVLDGTVKTTQSSVEQAVERLKSHEEVVTSIGEAATRLNDAAEKLTEMRDTFDLSSQRNVEAAEAQKAATEGNQAVATQFETIGEKLPEVRDTISDASRVIASLGQPLLELHEILQKTPGLFEQQAEQQAESADQRSAILLRQTEELAATVADAAAKFAQVESLGRTLSESAGSLERAGTALAEFGTNVKNASDQQVISAAASEKASLASERTADTLSPIPQVVANLAGQLDAAGSSIRTGADAARDSYEKLIEFQNIWFQGVETGLLGTKVQLQDIIDQYGEKVEGQTQEHMDQWVKVVDESLQSFSVQIQALEGAANDLTETINRR